LDANMKKILTPVLAVAALTLSAAAQANVPQQQVVNSNVLSNVKNKTGVLDFTQFDASLGTLQSVEVFFSSDLGATYKIENKSSSSGSDVTIDSKNSLALTSAAFSLPVLTNNYLNTVHENVFDTNDDWAGTSGQIITLAGATAQHASESHLFTDALTLAAFTGTGSVHASVTGTALATMFSSTSGNLHASASTLFSAYGKVVYTYALPVPEPETYAMLLSGLGLMGLVLRKRKAA
jgi:hypothetical protein